MMQKTRQVGVKSLCLLGSEMDERQLDEKKRG